MKFRFLVVASLLLASLPHAQAQFGSGNLRIRVTYTNGRAAPRNLLVQLMSGASNSPVTSAYTNDQGGVEFDRLAVGVYHVLVSGDGIEKTDSETFEVDSRKMTQSQVVSVRRLDEVQGSAANAGDMISASTLAVPENARKLFQKGGDAMAREDWKRALDALNKAVAIYPQYAAAYTNLGVVYSRLNDPVQERAVLEKAISLDDRMATAYLNLGVLSIRQKDFPQAQKLLQKAAALDPAARTYMFLADAQLLSQQYDAAIASAQKAHSLPHDNLALTHYIAARAYEHENQPQSAIAELQLFLQEEPQGVRADQVRGELKQLQRQIQ